MKGIIIQQTDLFELQASIRAIVREELSCLQLPITPSSVAIDETLISKSEASKFIGVTMPTFNKMIRDHAIKIYKVGKRQKFKKSQLLLSLEQAPKRFQTN